MVFRPGDNPNPTGIGGFTAGGPSPNPRGRPKGAQQIQNRALEMCTRALELLGEIMDGKVDKSIGHLQLAAAQAILDRGVGRAGQSLAIAIDIRKKLSELTHGELIALRENYLAATKPKLIEMEPEKDEGG
jgi:hypothetical protein